jgi:hypothetical protein
LRRCAIMRQPRMQPGFALMEICSLLSAHRIS